MIEKLATSRKYNKESSRTESLIPTYLRENAAAFIAFLKHYYIFMSQTGAVDSWTILDRGSNYTTSTNVTTIGGHGVGLTVDISVNSTSGISSFTINKPGIGYEPDDIIYISNDASPQNLASFKVVEIIAEPTYVIDHILSEHDLDQTKEEYLDNLALEIAKGVPAAPKIDRRTLFKNIVKYYNTRGSFDSIHTFFKVFFDADVTVTNASAAWTYIIRTDVPGAEWEDTYKALVHPAGMKYIVSYWLEIFADNDFTAGSIDIPAGSDIIDIFADDWMHNLYVAPGNHTPTLQIGWLRTAVEFWFEILAGQYPFDGGIGGYYDPTQLITPNMIDSGTKHYSHINGLLLIPQYMPDTYLDNNCIGNCDHFVGIQEILESGQSSGYMETKRFYLARNINYVENETLTPISSSYLPTSYQDLFTDRTFNWKGDSINMVTFDQRTSPTDKMFVRGIPTTSGFMPIVLTSGNSGTIYFTQYTTDPIYIDDIKVDQFGGKALTTSYSGGYIWTSDLSGAHPIEVGHITLSFLVDYQAPGPFGYMTVSADDGISVQSSYVDIADPAYYEQVTYYTSGPLTTNIRWYQFEFVVEDVTNVEFTMDFHTFSPIGKFPFNVFVRNGGKYIFDKKDSFDSKAMNSSYITDEQKDFTLSQVNPNTILGYAVDLNDGTSAFEITNGTSVDQNVTLKISDSNEIIEYDFFMDNDVITPRFISWETTFDDLTKIDSSSPYSPSMEEDVYTIDDFDGTPIIGTRGDIHLIINHSHLNHYDGDYLKGTI